MMKTFCPTLEKALGPQKYKSFML